MKFLFLKQQNSSFHSTYLKPSWLSINTPDYRNGIVGLVLRAGGREGRETEGGGPGPAQPQGFRQTDSPPGEYEGEIGLVLTSDENSLQDLDPNFLQE